MSRNVSANYTDTPISGVTSLAFNRGLVNTGADFKVKVIKPDEVIITNLSSPILFPEKIRYSLSDVNDVYKGTGIDPGFFAPSRKGLSLLAQVTETWTVTDTTDATYQVALPVSAHLVLKVPNNEAVTPERIEQLIGRLISTLYDTGKSDNKRLTALLRGSLTPSDI